MKSLNVLDVFLFFCSKIEKVMVVQTQCRKKSKDGVHFRIFVLTHLTPFFQMSIIFFFIGPPSEIEKVFYAHIDTF